MSIENSETLRRAVAVLQAENERLRRRLAAMMPLFEEARDALPAIPLAAAKLRNLRLDLADRMDAVGNKELWEAAEAVKEQPDE